MKIIVFSFCVLSLEIDACQRLYYVPCFHLNEYIIIVIMCFLIRNKSIYFYLNISTFFGGESWESVNSLVTHNCACTVCFRICLHKEL